MTTSRPTVDAYSNPGKSVMSRKPDRFWYIEAGTYFRLFLFFLSTVIEYFSKEDFKEAEYASKAFPLQESFHIFSLCVIINALVIVMYSANHPLHSSLHKNHLLAASATPSPVLGARRIRHCRLNACFLEALDWFLRQTAVRPFVMLADRDH